jgi:predicted GNAT family acetyltransferase
MQDVTITIHPAPDGASGEYHAHVPGMDTIGRLTWVRHGNAHVADHTLVPPEIGGRGVAAKLVEALIEDARTHGFRIRPTCSYVAAQFRRHPEWSDLLA